MRLRPYVRFIIEFWKWHRPAVSWAVAMMLTFLYFGYATAFLVATDLTSFLKYATYFTGLCFTIYFYIFKLWLVFLPVLVWFFYTEEWRKQKQKQKTTTKARRGVVI